MKNSKTGIRFYLSATLSVFLLGLAILFTPHIADAHPVPHKKAKTYVLVHGAWQAAYSWNQVKAILEKKGNKVIVVELPGHGKDQTDASTITMDSYKAIVVAAVQAQQEKVVLVGHSLGGMVISATAEAIPAKIERLIYIGAFVPKNGQSLIEVSGGDTESLLKNQLAPASPVTLGVTDLSQIGKLFADDATDAVKKELADNYRPDPIIPFTNPVSVTAEKFGSVAKSYIRTTKDLAVGLALQNQMIKDAGITDVHDIISSHCPHLSKPEELTGLLISISK